MGDLSSRSTLLSPLAPAAACVSAVGAAACLAARPGNDWPRNCTLGTASLGLPAWGYTTGNAGIRAAGPGDQLKAGLEVHD